MNSKRKIIATILIVIMLCATCCIMSACPKQEKEKKYDVSMKIFCREVVNGRMTGPILDEVTFTSDVSEMYIEREYNGKQYCYYLAKLESPNYISPSYQWISVGGEVHSALWKDDEPKENIYECVSDRGHYTLLIRAYDIGGHSFSWNARTLRLHINNK